MVKPSLSVGPVSSSISLCIVSASWGCQLHLRQIIGKRSIFILQYQYFFFKKIFRSNKKMPDSNFSLLDSVFFPRECCGYKIHFVQYHWYQQELFTGISEIQFCYHMPLLLFFLPFSVSHLS